MSQIYLTLDKYVNTFINTSDAVLRIVFSFKDFLLHRKIIISFCPLQYYLYFKCNQQ